MAQRATVVLLMRWQVVPCGIMFHHFCDDSHPKGQGAISASDFADLLRHVGLERILPADEWMRRAIAGQLTDDDLCVTFDDAMLCQYDIAFPVLRDLGLTAFWFIYSSVFCGKAEKFEIYRYFRTTCYDDVDQFYGEFFRAVHDFLPYGMASVLVDFDPDRYLSAFPFYTRNDRIFRFLRDDVLGPARFQRIQDSLIEAKGFDLEAAARKLWMNDDHLRQLQAAGHVLGLHSYSHPTRLADLPLAEQLQEYRQNDDHLRRVLGTAPICMSHPCNSYTQELLPALQSMGIRLGFCSNMAQPRPPSPLEYPRQDHANLMKAMGR